MKYVLMLNDMRNSNIENLKAVKVAATKQELIDFHDAELVESYWETGPGHPWNKRFRKGGPLEWFNPVDGGDFDDNFFGGIYGVSDDIPDEEVMAARLTKF